MNIFCTGGAGYCASLLVPILLSHGHNVTVYDIMYFGHEHLFLHPRLKIIDGDIRDTAKLGETCKGHDVFINLACITNDASFELDEALSKSINYDCFEPMVVAAKQAGIKRFVSASTSSVYGVSKEPDVTEGHPLVPLTLYNKYKGMTEPLLLKHASDDFTCVIFRPATVCGYAPRLRLDLSVNILTYQAYKHGKITVFGGSQLRPNLNIRDYVDVVELLMNAPAEKIQGQIFNVGFQNMSILNIAKLVQMTVSPREVSIEVKPSDDDIRSYHINSDKIRRMLGFVPRYSIEDAVNSLMDKFTRADSPQDYEDDIYYPVRRLKRMRAA